MKNKEKGLNKATESYKDSVFYQNVGECSYYFFMGEHCSKCKNNNK